MLDTKTTEIPKEKVFSPKILTSEETKTSTEPKKIILGNPEGNNKNSTLAGKRPEAEWKSDASKSLFSSIDQGESQIFVENLPCSTSNAAISEFFSQYGTVVHVKQINAQNSNIKAFVTFSKPEDANKARAASGVQFKDKHLIIRKALAAKSFTEQVKLIYIYNINPDTTVENLKKFFDSCGKVVDAEIFRDHLGSSKKAGCLEFENESSVRKAQDMNGLWLDGYKICVNRWNQNKDYGHRISDNKKHKSHRHYSNHSDDSYDDYSDHDRKYHKSRENSRKSSPTSSAYYPKEHSPNTTSSDDNKKSPYTPEKPKPPELPKFAGKCEKHTQNEITHYCFKCDKLLCFDCCLRHKSECENSQISCLQDIVLGTISKLEEDKRKICGDDNGFSKELRKNEESLREKSKIVENVFSNLKTTINNIVQGIENSQKSIIEQALCECKQILIANEQKTAKSESFNKSIENIKELYISKNFIDLIKKSHEMLNSDVSKNIENSQENIQKFPIIQLEDTTKVIEQIEQDCKKSIDLLNFVMRGCSICDKIYKDPTSLLECSICQKTACKQCSQVCQNCKKSLCLKCMQKCAKCSEVSCKTCLPKCLKCEQSLKCKKCDLGCMDCKICMKCMKECEKCKQIICEKCHLKCGPAALWCNKKIKIDRNENEHTLISTENPLPLFFKATIEIINCAPRSCWTIGISSKKFDGTDEYKLGKRPNLMLGCVMGITWKEFGWGPCSCMSKCANGLYTGKYGKSVENGRITLKLDKNHNLIGEIDGVSQGIIETNIPEAQYYLTFSGKKASGEIKILAIDESS